MVRYGRPKYIQPGYMAGKRNVKTTRRAFQRGQLGMIAALRSKTTEVKTVDYVDPAAGTALNYTAISATPAIVRLNNLALGTEIFNRIGRKCHMRSVHIKACIFQTGQVVVNDNFRIALVYDRQTASAGTAPVFADIFTSTTQAGTSTAQVWDFTNPTNFDRFVVLRDWKYSAPIVAAAANNSSAITDYKGDYKIDEYVKLGNLVAHYGATAVSGTAPVTGGLYLVFIGTVAAATAPYQAAWNARIRFSDTQ